MGYAIGQPVLWPCPPVWHTPVRESLGWLTDAMTAMDGTQQKRRLRLAPRRTLTFLSRVGGDARRLLDAVRFDTGIRQIVLPIYPDVQLLGTQVDAGAVAMPCRTAGFDFAVGGQAVLWQDAQRWEQVTIDAIAADSLTLTDATTRSWAPGTRLYPTRLARLQVVPRETQRTDNSGDIEVQCLIDEPCDWPAAWPSAATYRGVPVLEWRGEESKDPTDQYDRTTETVDEDIGPVAYFDFPGMPFRSQSQRFVMRDRTQYATFRSLAYALAGRAGQLWVPSWQADLDLLAPVAAADDMLQVAWCGYSVFGREQVNRRDLRIELRDGTVLYRRVTGSTEFSDSETLQLDAALGQDIAVGAVRQINWLSMNQLAADTVSIDYATDADGGAVSSLAWQAVKHDV